MFLWLAIIHLTETDGEVTIDCAGAETDGEVAYKHILHISQQ